MLSFGLCVHLFARGMLRGGDSAVGQVRKLRIDVNRARMSELMALPGIGPGRAEAIVLHRLRRGRFEAPEDLIDVPGIGPDTFVSVRPHVFVSGPENRRGR